MTARASLFSSMSLRRLACSGLLCAIAGAAAAPGCTLVADLESAQCATTTDCTARGPAFAATECSPDGLCVAVGALGCTTNQKCTDEHDGEPYVCLNPGEECVSLLSPECPQVVGNFLGEDPVIMGYFHPLTGPIAFIGEAAIGPMTLALEEWREVGGIKGRDFVMVLCDESTLALAEKGAEHLINNLHVSATVGPALSEYIASVAPKLYIPNDTLLFSIFAGGANVADLQDNGLVWSGWISDAAQGHMMALIGNKLEARVRAELDIPDEEPIRVGVELPLGANGYGETAAIEEALVFNGLPALDNGDNYKTFPHESPTQNPSVNLQAVADDIAAFRPHIMFYVASPDVLGLVEPALPEDAPRPYHILDGAGIEENLLVAVGQNEDLRRRVLGTFSQREQTPAYKPFAQRFEGRFGSDPVPGFEINYDAVYLLGFAAGAGSEAPSLTGSVIAQGLSRVTPPGQVVNASPLDIPAGLAALSVPSGRIDFEGAFGKFNFDVSTGMASHDLVVWCIRYDEDGNPIFDTSLENGTWTPNDPDVLSGPISCD